MKRLSLFLKLTLLLIFLHSCAQNKSPNVQIALYEAREIYQTTQKNYSDIIRQKKFKLKEISSRDPEVFGNLKEKSDKVERAIADLNQFIESLKDEYGIEGFDTSNYVISDMGMYDTLLFDDDNNLSQRGKELKKKIESLYKTNTEILGTDYPEPKTYNDVKFNTGQKFSDYEGNSVDYMNFKLSDRTVIGTLTYLERLQLESITFQYLFMNAIVSY